MIEDNFHVSHYSDSLVELWFKKFQADYLFLFEAFDFMPCDKPELNDVLEFILGLEETVHIEAYTNKEGIDEILARTPTYVVQLNIADTSTSIFVSSKDLGLSKKCAKRVLDNGPFIKKEKTKDKIPIYFWADGAAISRDLPIKPWNESMRVNYSHKILPELEAAINDNLDPGIIIWHGPPGVGKTNALRALISNREARTVHYITDPETFINKPGYIYSLLDYGRYNNEDKETLIICEDSGPLVTDRAGLGLGRILNLADGILGQGFNLRLLFTTNDPVTEFHPAVLRPGRCAQNLEFLPLTREESNAWCDHNNRPRVNESQTLAWLYANTKEEKAVAMGQYL